MKRLLLIGNLNKTLRGIQDCLMEQFQVQLCAERIDVIKDMMKLECPDIVVVSQIGLTEEDIEIFDFLAKKYNETPTLIVATKEMESHFSVLKEKSEKMLALYRPVTKTKLLEGCCVLLGITVSSESTLKSNKSYKKQELSSPKKF
jgi:hypothetical protein